METSIKGLIQGLASEGSGITVGVVTSVSPLEIQLINDDKVTLGMKSLCLPQHLTDYDIEVNLSGDKMDIAGVDVTGTTSDGASITSLSLQSSIISLTAGKITLFNALKVGDTVYLLAFNNGKKYYILDRMGT